MRMMTMNWKFRLSFEERWGNKRELFCFQDSGREGLNFFAKVVVL